jgi:hypothetical protein
MPTQFGPLEGPSADTQGMATKRGGAFPLPVNMGESAGETPVTSPLRGTGGVLRSPSPFQSGSMNDLPTLDPHLGLRLYVVREEPIHRWEGNPFVTDHQVMRIDSDPTLFLALLALPGTALGDWVLEDEVGEPRTLDEHQKPLLRYRAEQFRQVALISPVWWNRAVMTFLCALPPQMWVILEWF